MYGLTLMASDIESNSWYNRRCICSFNSLVVDVRRNEVLSEFLLGMGLDWDQDQCFDHCSVLQQNFAKSNVGPSPANFPCPALDL